MKINFCILLTVSIISVNSYAQTDTLLTNLETIDCCSGNILQLNTSKKIIIGKKLLVGKGSDENGWYSSIRFKSPFNWSLWLFKDAELNTTTNPDRIEATQERENDKLKGFLHEGDSLIIKKIKKTGNRKSGYVYILYLKGTKFPKTNFVCNIELAIKNKEIIIE